MENTNDSESKIIEIRHPNTIQKDLQTSYGYYEGFRFEKICKNGEMALINWFRVFKNDNLILEIKESVCDIYYN